MLEDVEMGERRELAQVTLVGNSVDHRPYMSGVKNQGSCGSCWSFAGNSVLEGTLNRNGSGTARLSEQMPVDCARYSEANYNHFSA
jgi:C1A family cysteine protease